MRVTVVPYDDRWPDAFAALRDELAARLAGVGDVRIEHVGSTAVPGLAAKPVLDVDVVVDEARLASAVAALGAAGYTHRGERGVPGRHAFDAPPGGVPRHVYVCLDGCLALRNHLAVRDVLRRDPALRARYAETKTALAAQDLASVEEYVAGKTAVLADVLRAAGLGEDDLAAVAAVNAGATPGVRDAPCGTAVHVVGGILTTGGRVLLGHRSTTRRWYADAWDIPGGHVEEGETGRAALERELREELGVGVVAADGLGTARVGDVLIELWVVTAWSGTPTNRAPDEHDELRWFTAADLPVGELAHDTLEPVLRAVLAGTRPPSVTAADGRPGREQDVSAGRVPGQGRRAGDAASR